MPNNADRAGRPRACSARSCASTGPGRACPRRTWPPRPTSGTMCSARSRRGAAAGRGLPPRHTRYPSWTPGARCPACGSPRPPRAAPVRLLPGVGRRRSPAASTLVSSRSSFLYCSRTGDLPHAIPQPRPNGGLDDLSDSRSPGRLARPGPIFDRTGFRPSFSYVLDEGVPAPRHQRQQGHAKRPPIVLPNGRTSQPRLRSSRRTRSAGLRRPAAPHAATGPFRENEIFRPNEPWCFSPRRDSTLSSSS